MSEALLFLNEPQTVTQWKGAGHDPVSAAESLYIDDLTGDIVVTSLVGANAAKGRVSYSQARFFAGEGACGSPKTQYSGECTSSSSVVTTPSRLITTVTIGCRSGPSRAIVAARRFPRAILMRSGATNASPVSTSSSSATTTPPKTFSSSNPNSAVQYEPAYLVAVSLDTRTIRFYAAPPQRNQSTNNDTAKGTVGQVSPSNNSGRSPNGDDGFSQLYFTVNLGAYTCCPNSLRFRGDFYHIRHFYWASNSVRQEHGSATSRSEISSSASNINNKNTNNSSSSSTIHNKEGSRGDDAMVLVSSALDVNENLSRNFYVRSKLLLGGGGMIVPSPPEVSDAAIRRTVGGLLSSVKDGEENVDEERSPSRSQPSSPLYAEGAAAAGFSTRSAAGHLSFPTPNCTSSSPSNPYLEAVERRSGMALSSQVSRLHSSLQRDHMMVVFTEISVDLVFVDFKSSASSSSPTKNTSAFSSSAANTGKGGAQAATADGSSGSAALGQASRSGCEGMVVVLRRIPTRIDFWHTCPSLHVSVVINHLKPTNVKPIAELGGFTWIMPQFKIAGLQPIPLPSTASTSTHHTTTTTTTAAGTRAGPNKLGSPFYIADMQVPGAAPSSTSQQLPSTSSSFARAPPMSYYFPLQIIHVSGHVYLAFVDYTRGVVVLYRYQHNNDNGSVVDMSAAMQRAAERLQSREKEQQTAASIPALGAQQQTTDSSLTGSKGGNLTPASALRYYTSTSQQHADPNQQQQFPNNSSLFQYNSSSSLVHNNSNLGGSGTSPSTMFPSSYAYRNDTNPPSSAAVVPPTTKLSSYALDPYKKAATVTHVASLISEGQPMPPTVLLEERSGEGASSPFVVSAEAFSSPLTGEDNPNLLGVNVGSAYYGGGAGNSPRTSVNMTATSTNFGGSRAFAAEPSSVILSTAVVFGNSSDNPSSVSFVGAVAGESSYLPLSDAVANAVGALERASLPTTGANARTGSAANNSGGAGVGTGGSGNSTSSVPSTVQSAIFTGVANASANNFAFAPNGSLVHTFSNVSDLGNAASGSGGCCTWEVAYVLPLPALSIVSALRSEWYYGADIAASYRWFTSTSAVKGGLQRSSHSPALTSKKMPSSLAASASSSAAEAPLVALGLGSPILLQTSPDGLIYAHFPDVRPPPDNEVSRGACHLVTAYDIKLAIVEGSVAGMACGDLSGTVSHQRALVVNAAPNIYGDPHTVERATQSVADAYEAFSMSYAQHASLSLAGLGAEGEGEGERIGRGTELLLAPEGGRVSGVTSVAVSPEASPSPIRAASRRGGGGGLSHNSIHGISAFRALASVSSYFTASGSRPESADESVLSPEELLLLRKQQWIRHVTQMRVSEVSSERYVDVGSDSDCAYRRSCALFASDTLWREMLQYLCARPHPDGGSMSNSPSFGGGPHPSISAPHYNGRRTLDGGLLILGARPSDGEGHNKAKSAGGGGWFKNLFSRASDGAGGKGNGGKSAEETDVFPYAPVVHHLPLDVLTSPFDGSIRVATGCASPLLALAPPSPHQPFVVSTVRHNALSIITRFDCFSEEIWGLGALRQGMVSQYSSLMPRKGAQSDVHNLTSPSRAHSAGFFFGGAGGGTNLSSTGGIRLRRPHFGPGGHYQRSLCFAAQFVLNRRAHMINVAGEGGAGGVSVPPSSVVLDSVSVVRSVLVRSLATLESQAVIGRLFDVIVAHHCSNLDSAAWYRYWRNRWEPLQSSNPSSPLHPPSTSALSSPIAPDTKSQNNRSPVAEQPTTLSDFLSAMPAGLMTTDMAARLRIVAGLGATLDANVAEYARFARTYAQPHLWPVNTPAKMTPLDPIVLSYTTSAAQKGLEEEKGREVIDAFENDSSNHQRSEAAPTICVEIAVVPAAMDASLVYESVIVPMLQQLAALADSSSSSPARSAAVVSPQAAQAGYSFFKAYVLSSLFEYCRSTVQHGLTITVPIQSSLLELLLGSSGSGPQRSLGFGFGGSSGYSSLQQTHGGALSISERRQPEISPTYSPNGGEDGRLSESSLSAGEAQAAYFRLHQLLMYRALEDHIPTAMQLIALQHAYPPAFQMGLDILGRLGAHSIIVQVFIARRMPVRAAKYLLYNKGLGNKSGAISAVGVGTLPSAEDLSNIVAILECTAALHDEERRAVTDTHVPLRPAKPPAVLAHEAAVAKATEAGTEPPEAPEDVEALRHIAAVVNYLDRRLAKKKLKYSTQMTTSGALFCNVYTMLVQQWVEVSLRTYNATVAGANSSNNGIRGRYSTYQPASAAPPVSDPAKAYPQLRPFAARYEQLKAGTMI